MILPSVFAKTIGTRSRSSQISLTSHLLTSGLSVACVVHFAHTFISHFPSLLILPFRQTPSVLVERPLPSLLPKMQHPLPQPINRSRPIRLRILHLSVRPFDIYLPLTHTPIQHTTPHLNFSFPLFPSTQIHQEATAPVPPIRATPNPPLPFRFKCFSRLTPLHSYSLSSEPSSIESPRISFTLKQTCSKGTPKTQIHPSLSLSQYSKITNSGCVKFKQVATRALSRHF